MATFMAGCPAFRWLSRGGLFLILVINNTLAADVDYLRQIKPLLEKKCYACHGVIKQEAELRLETKALMLSGGDSGAVIVPGKPEESLLYQRVTDDEDSRMPPAGEGSALKPEEQALLREWIAQGAVAPEEQAPESPLDHWAFQRIERPSWPNDAPHADADRHPIDRLLNAKQRRLGLKPQPQAPRSILIRRLYLDLIGLPPTRSQLHDKRPWEEIVDELLASPHHGERWGRHWMDIWRYSDWYGLGKQLRYSQKHLWHWRDWIVDSLNTDKGYDRMIQEMLAGDELAPDDPQAIAGTGFLARNYYLFNRTTWLDSTIEHTGKAFLGLTLNCMKCHDHKYDPFTQMDYYSLRAIFEPHQVRLDPVPGVIDFEQDGLPRVFDDHLEAKTLFHVKGNPKNPDPSREIVPRVPELFAHFQPPIEPIQLPTSAFAPGTREAVQRDRLQAAERALKQAEAQLSEAQQKQALVAAAGKSDPSPTDAFQFVDDFDAPRLDAWELIGTHWAYQDGTLVQTQASRDSEMAKLKLKIPKDFELTCRYTTTGGTTYKSVTFRFDQSDDGNYANFVYTSAHEPAPKVQIAYTRQGKHIYPPEGRAPRQIKVGKTYELRFAVRDRLVNIWLDGKFLLAHSLPDRRPEGALTLSGFDATVAFDSISIRSLPKETVLTEAKTGASSKPANGKHAVAVAQAMVKLRQAELSALQAVCQADLAKYQRPQAPDFERLAQIAARKQAEVQLAQAALDRLQAGTDAKKQKAAEAKEKQARDKLAAIEQGDLSYRSLRASRKALETPAHKEDNYPAAYSPTSTGRRLALARWITSRENPLTARVAVNHVWMRHFGEPLVESVFDFGMRAPEPVHRDLLDYLAVEFIESGWSFKHLHRLIVTSEAYRMSSSPQGADPHTIAADPTNLYYWRMNTRRMDAQTVRDSLLHLAGKLDLTLGGPSVDIGNGSRRRSLYYKHSRDQQDPFLSVFDDADILQCYRRSESIVPQQALALANSQLSMTMAQQIADRIERSLMPQAKEEQFVTQAFEFILGRVPSRDELAECLRFRDQLKGYLSTTSDASRDIDGRVRVRFVHSLLNHNDFISIR